MKNPVDRRTLRLGALLSLASLSVLAATDEEVYFSELPVVASVSRLPQRLADAPTSVTVIDREMIRALPIRDLNDIFRLVPGFQTYPNNTEAARVVYHGLTDEEFSPRVQVLVDGRSMYSPAFRNGVNWGPGGIRRLLRPSSTTMFAGCVDVLCGQPAAVQCQHRVVVRRGIAGADGKR